MKNTRHYALLRSTMYMYMYTYVMCVYVYVPECMYGAKGTPWRSAIWSFASKVNNVISSNSNLPNKALHTKAEELGYMDISIYRGRALQK